MQIKKIMVAAVAACVALGAMADGINFMPHDALLKDAVAKAKAENKMVFLDCYTSWCGPCKAMAKKVFPLDTVGEYMNPRFVSIKIDMEKGEGPALAKKYEVSAFPTFIIFNGDGGEVGRFMGGSDAAGFINRVKEKSKDSGAADMDKRFDNGDRSEAFLREYIETLGNAYKRDRSNQVAEIILAGKESSFAKDAYLADVFMKYVQNPLGPAFRAVIKDPSALEATVGEKNAQMKIFSVLEYFPRQLVSGEGADAKLDEKRLNEFVALVKEAGNPRAEHYNLATRISYAQKKQDWKGYVALVEKYTKNKDLDAGDIELCKWAKPIAETCTDAAARKSMSKILQKRLDDLNSGKRQPQTSIGSMRLAGDTRPIFTKLIGDLAK